MNRNSSPVERTRERINRIRANVSSSNPIYQSYETSKEFESNIRDHQANIKEMLATYKALINTIISRQDDNVKERNRLLERYDGRVPTESSYSNEDMKNYQDMMDEWYANDRMGRAWNTATSTLDLKYDAEVHVLSRYNGRTTDPSILFDLTIAYISPKFVATVQDSEKQKLLMRYEQGDYN